MNNLNEFIFETFEEAMDIHTKLFKMGRTKGYITYTDLYSMIHPDDNCSEICDTHGWTNLWDIKISENDNGKYVLILPPIKKIKKGE